ncbi:MAG: extensin family protein [Sphingorhabdus sp.]
MISPIPSKCALPAVLALALVSCVGEGRDPRGAAGDHTSFATQSARQCLGNLKSQNISFKPLSNRNYGGGCRAHDSVQLLNFGTPTTNLGPMTCTLASGFADWTRDIVRPAARKYLGSRLVRVETSGTYSCRRVNGSGNLSQHAFANAVDVFAFVLADGRKVTVLGGWRGNKSEQRFLQSIHKDACGRFGTVLGPGYNRQHANHFHLDMAKSRLAGNPFCR